MKKLYCILGISLLIACMTTGCKNQKPNQVENIGMESKEKEKKEENILSEEDILITVGDLDVSYKDILAYIYLLKQDYEESLGTEVWSFELNEGETFEDYAKEEIIRNITQMRIINSKAQIEGIVLSDEEKEDIQKMAAEFVSGVSTKDQKNYGITKERMEQIYGENQLANKMFDITTNEVDTNISNEEAKQITIQYLMVMIEGEDKNGNAVKLTEEEAKDAYKKAKKLRKEAKQVENFYNFAEANTDDYEVELTFGENDMPTEFGENAFSLKTGELSDIVKTEYGYYILYCVSDFDEEATTEKKEEIINDKQNELFQSTYTEWSKDYEVELNQKLWKLVHFIK